jgi:hypothetical protein
MQMDTERKTRISERGDGNLLLQIRKSQQRLEKNFKELPQSINEILKLQRETLGYPK